MNNVGTNLGEIRIFTTGILHQNFSLNGATDSEQSGVIYPGGSHTYNVPLSNTHSYNLTIDAASNILNNFAIYENTTTNELYIQAGPFSETATADDYGLTNITITFSGTNNGRRYLVLPLTNLNHRLVLTNSNINAESYNLTLREETGTASYPVGRLLVDGSFVSFTNNEPEFYWLHIPHSKTNWEGGIWIFDSGVTGACVFYWNMRTVTISVFSNYIAISPQSSPKTNGYFMLRFYNSPSHGVNIRGCQYRFRIP